MNARATSKCRSDKFGYSKTRFFRNLWMVLMRKPFLPSCEIFFHIRIRQWTKRIITKIFIFPAIALKNNIEINFSFVRDVNFNVNAEFYHLRTSKPHIFVETKLETTTDTFHPSGISSYIFFRKTGYWHLYISSTSICSGVWWYSIFKDTTNFSLERNCEDSRIQSIKDKYTYKD